MEPGDNIMNIENQEYDEAEAFELEQELQAAHDETKRIKSEIANLKKRMTSRRREIAAREKRFDAMPEEKKEAVRSEYDDAVLWRTREIVLMQSELAALEAKAAVAQDSVQGAAQQLEPLGISTSPRARRQSGSALSPRQRETRARARTKRWSRRAQKMRAQLKAERDHGPPVRADLEAAALAAEKRVERIAAAIDQAKVQIKKRKRELNEWKQWYSNLPDIDKTAEKATLDQEITWRADEIQSLQTRIGTLEADKLAADGEQEQARIQIEALRAGAYDRPLENDPRLAHIEDIHKKADSALSRVRKSAQRSRSTKKSAKPRQRKADASQRRQPTRKSSRKK